MKIFRKRNLFIIALALAFACTGCHHHHHDGEEHEHEHEHEHGHGHDHETCLQLTAYGNHWEVYAEAHPFVTGHASELRAHVTDLNTFKPRKEGRVTAILTIGGQSVTQAIDTPNTPGIYEFALMPKQQGHGSLLFIIDGDTLAVNNIQAYGEEEAALEAAEEVQVKSDAGATFTKEQSWKVDFATEPCRQEPFGQVIKTVAQVMPSQGDEQVVTAHTSGIVLPHSRDLVQGKAVSKGQTLFTIESGDMIDNNLSVRYQEAAAEYEQAKSEYERKKELNRDKIVSDGELARAKSAYEKAAALYESCRNVFKGGNLTIKAPLGGYIRQLYVQPGQFVEAGQPLATVAQNRSLTVRADVQPKYYPWLAQIETANFRSINGKQTYSLDDLKGKVLSYGKATGETNALVPVLFQLDNPQEFIPGTFVETYIKTRSAGTAVTVPNTALTEEMGNCFVYVQLTPECFEKRAVSTGATDGLRTAITSGLEGSERIVAKGAIFVKLAQASGKLDAHSGHHH